MNHHVLPPLAAVLLTGFPLPVLLERARWAAQAPRLAVATWGALGALFVFSLSMVAVQWLLPAATSHWLSSLLLVCLPWTGQSPLASPPTVTEWDYAALAAGSALLLAPAVAFLREVVLARRKRARHADRLRLVGVANPGLGVTVLDHPAPAVYCLPGRASQVVVTTGALEALNGAQLESVLEHERAHVAGRHHLSVAAIEGFGAVYRRLPLARMLRANVPMLLEMVADDRALRSCSRACLATALYTLATTQVTGAAAFAATGSCAVLRVRRLLAPGRGRHPVLCGLGASSFVVMLLAIPVGVCCSVPL